MFECPSKERILKLRNLWLWSNFSETVYYPLCHNSWRRHILLLRLTADSEVNQNGLSITACTIPILVLRLWTLQNFFKYGGLSPSINKPQCLKSNLRIGYDRKREIVKIYCIVSRACGIFSVQARHFGKPTQLLNWYKWEPEGHFVTCSNPVIAFRLVP